MQLHLSNHGFIVTMRWLEIQKFSKKSTNALCENELATKCFNEEHFLKNFVDNVVHIFYISKI